MGFDFEVGEESEEHFGILPVHLHVVEFAVESDGVEKPLKGWPLKEEGVSAETKSPNRYSTHSRWLKFLLMICKQVFPIWLRDRSTRLILFIDSRLSIY